MESIAVAGNGLPYAIWGSGRVPKLKAIIAVLLRASGGIELAECNRADVSFHLLERTSPATLAYGGVNGCGEA
jgi:hypothetical protein